MSRGLSPLKVQEWRDRFSRFGSGKQTVVEFCRSEGVSQPSFYAWRKKLSSMQPAAVAAPQSLSVADASVGQMNFEPVPVVPTGAESGLKVRLPGGVELEFGNDLDVIRVVVKQLTESSLQETGRQVC